jgi:hypothetical protein
MRDPVAAVVVWRGRSDQPGMAVKDRYDETEREE